MTTGAACSKNCTKITQLLVLRVCTIHNTFLGFTRNLHTPRQATSARVCHGTKLRDLLLCKGVPSILARIGKSTQKCAHKINSPVTPLYNIITSCSPFLLLKLQAEAHQRSGHAKSIPVWGPSCLRL